MAQYALVIDLNVCVGCHACAVNCKEWNTQASFGPLSDYDPYGENPSGVWYNRVLTFEVGEFPHTQIFHLPKSCLHCQDAPCVPVCPTGASYKREQDGIVLVNYSDCIGCKLCSWSCPYGCREFDEVEKVMKKCTLCIDRIYDETLPPEQRKPACVLTCPAKARFFGDIEDPDSEAYRVIKERGGFVLFPSASTNPSNHYLPRVEKRIDLSEFEEHILRADNPLFIEVWRRHHSSLREEVV